MATQLENNTTSIESLISAINAMPNAITIDSTLTQSGKAADAKATGDALAGKAASSHNQSASTITAGTFAGQVVAKSTTQAPATSLLRNSKLVTTATNPANNGEIYWTYA